MKYKFPVTEKKNRELGEAMDSSGILEGDLIEEFVRGSGSGGQKLNKTSSCVLLLHKVSSLRVRCEKDRSRELNRFFARRLMVDKFRKLNGMKLLWEEDGVKKRKNKKKKAKRSKEKYGKEK